MSAHNEPVTKHAKEQAQRVITSPRKMWQLMRETVSAWVDDFAPSMGAAISYYTVFSIAPLLLIVIAVAGLVLGREAASGQIFAQLQGLMGSDGAAAIQGMVKSASDPGKSTLATIIGVVTLMFGATTVFAELQSALDRIWEAPAAAKKEGLWNLLRTRALSFGMILGVGFLLLVSLVVTAGIAAIGTWWGPLFSGWEALLQVVNFLFSLVVVSALFAMIYKWLPRARSGWHDVWIGAGVTALLFTIGKFLIGLYIGKSSVVSGFGAAGALAVVLVWVYYSAQIFLLGAEFTWVYAYRYGSRQGQRKAAEADSNVATAIPTKSRLADASEHSGLGTPEARSGRRRWPLRPRAKAPATRRAVAFLNRNPRLELALAVVIGSIAGVAAFRRRRSRG
ncbi:MAG: YihY/virulence factor BrkB family protein [Betaproteobacteria bacterium]